MPFAYLIDVREHARLTFPPARACVPSWNTYAEEGTLSLRVLRGGEACTPWLPFARWSPHERRSLSPRWDDLRVETDVIRGEDPFDGIELHAAGVEFSLLAAATPWETRPSLPYLGPARILDVPQRSQYVRDDERGWCSAASLSMLHAYWKVDASVEEVAAGVYDAAYRGTGNWSFNVAFSGARGLRAAVAFLRNLDHAQRLIERSIPLALSYDWEEGELPGAPLPRSDGHLAVLCGFTANGDCAVNDPAAPAIRCVYPRAALERVWLRHGGIVYATAPAGVPLLEVLAEP